MINWTLKTFAIKDLRDNPKNPRKLSDKQYQQLKESLDKFGLIDKPICTKDGLLIGGHQRKQVLKKSGVKEVECYVPDRELEPKEIDELMIRLNRNHGEFDFDMLANEFDITDLNEWGFEASDFAIDEIEKVPNEEPDNDILEPGKDDEAITKLGDQIVLGDHRLVCGDSTNPDYVEACLNGEEPILMVTDPPYGVEYDPNWRGKAGKGQKAGGKVQNDDRINWALAWHLFPGAVAYVWHAGKFCGEVQNSLNEAEFEIISQIVWVKQNFALSRGDYYWRHEPCWYAHRKGHSHNWQGSRKEATVWEIANMNAFGKSKEDERTAHSTQKPLECMARPIRNNTATGEGVYDPFLGSGTTLMACEQLERKCFGIELSPAYCDIIVKRWIKYRQKLGKSIEVICNGEIDERWI